MSSVALRDVHWQSLRDVHWQSLRDGLTAYVRYLLSKGASDSIENKDRLVCRALARPQPQA